MVRGVVKKTKMYNEPIDIDNPYSSLSENSVVRKGNKRAKVRGGRFIDDLFNPSKVMHEIKKIPSLPRKAVEKVVETARDIFRPDYSNFPEPSKRVLEERGSYPIISLEINRTPLGKPIQGFINALTLGKFKEGQKESGYDKFFHLALIATVRTPNNQNLQVVMQKNARIEITKTFKSDANTEYLQIPLKSGVVITPNVMLELTRRRLGDTTFFRYDSFTNNCQVFIQELLKSINLYGKREKDFVYQDTLSVVKKIPSWNREILNWTTDAGNVFSKLTGSGKRRKVRGGKLEKCPTGYTDFGLTCTRCTWKGCNTTSKVNVAETINEVKRGVEDAGKVVTKAFDKFGSMTKEAFVGVYNDIKKKHPEINKIEDGFRTVVKAGKMTVANKDWWNKTMTTPDTYILLVSTAFTIASLAGVPAAGTLASATKILGDLAQGRPINISDINSLALSLIPVPSAGNVVNAGMFDKVKTAMIGAKSMTAAQRAAVVGKNIVTASNALIDTYGKHTIPNVIVPPPYKQPAYGIDDSNAELPNYYQPERSADRSSSQTNIPTRSNVIFTGGKKRKVGIYLPLKNGGREFVSGYVKCNCCRNARGGSALVSGYLGDAETNSKLKALKPCDSGYTDFGLTCTRCVWQGWKLSCNTVSKVDWNEVADDIKKAFQPLINAYQQVADAFNKYAGMTRQAFTALAGMASNFWEELPLNTYEFFYAIEEKLQDLAWWKDVMTDPMTYIFLICVICSGGAVIAGLGEATAEAVEMYQDVIAFMDILKIIVKLAKGQPVTVTDVITVILDFIPKTSSLTKGASFMTSMKEYIIGVSTADKLIIIGKYFLTALNFAEGNVSLSDFLAGLTATENAQNGQEQANAGNGVTPPEPNVPPPVPIPRVRPCDLGTYDDQGYKRFTPDECSQLKGTWYADQRCETKDGKTNYSVMCRIPPPCSLGTLDDKGFRRYTKPECDRLQGNWYESGECVGKEGNYTNLCQKVDDPCSIGTVSPNGYYTYTEDDCIRLEGKYLPATKSCLDKDGYDIGTKCHKQKSGGGKQELVLHSVNIKNTVPLEKAKQIARDITKINKDRYFRETKNWIRFRHIAKTKFQPKSYVTKKVNKDIELIFGYLK